MIGAGWRGCLSTFGGGLDGQVFCAGRSTADTSMEDPYESCDRAGFDFLVRSFDLTEQEKEKLLSTDDLYRLCLASPLLLLRHVECTTPPPIVSSTTSFIVLEVPPILQRVSIVDRQISSSLRTLLRPHDDARGVWHLGPGCHCELCGI